MNTISMKKNSLKDYFQLYAADTFESILLLDTSANILLANNTFLSFFDYTLNDLLEKKISSILPDFSISYLEELKLNQSFSEYVVPCLSKQNIPTNMICRVKKIMLDSESYVIMYLTEFNSSIGNEAEIKSKNKHLEKEVSKSTEQLTTVVNQLLEMNANLKAEIKLRKDTESALKQNELELIQSLEKEKKLSEIKSRFISTTSHEFRTPLSTINSSAGLIKKYTKLEDQEKRVTHINKISNSVLHLNSILDDLLSLSKLEEGKITFKTSNLNIVQLTLSVIESLKSILKENQEIIFNFVSEAIYIENDEAIIKNILLNIFSNAIKYSDSNIYCSIEVINNEVKIELTDHGIGIPEEEQQYLFERFYRAKNAAHLKGTGLGLNIVKKYLEIFNGKITFESKQNQFTTFTISIPFISKL
ncbi:MAG: PAS domain-containing sensor histidine kinase [Saprospiraceae bacterium]|nr:PAS domain-containing sensor histidine kinase [Saprospiraceae bacterium]